MFNFVSVETFNRILDEYIASLSLNRQAKALITQELADKAKSILLNEESTSDGNLRYWSRKHFSTLEINDTIQLVDKESLKVVCLKNDLYNVIGRLHQELQHAGYHKTYKAVGWIVKLVSTSIITQFNRKFFPKIVAQYSYIPRVVVQKFVNACNVCANRRQLLTPSTIRPIIALEFMSRLQVITIICQR